jgi:hypothetical protein
MYVCVYALSLHCTMCLCISIHYIHTQNSGKSCPRGHELKHRISLTKNWFCDSVGCMQGLTTGELVRRACKICNYHLCEKCYAALDTRIAVAAAARPKSEVQRLSQRVPVLYVCMYAYYAQHLLDLQHHKSRLFVYVCVHLSLRDRNMSFCCMFVCMHTMCSII